MVYRSPDRFAQEMSATTEIVIRVIAAAGLFAALAAWESLAPRRQLVAGRRPRWPSNIGVWIIDAMAVRLLMPIGAIGVALIASERGWGLLNVLKMPGWIAVLLGVVVLDLVIYAQHVVFHKVPWLWRLHRMHHADLDIDVTTGARFHPIEILLSMLIKIVAVVTIGVPALGVLIFEVGLNATSMFNHSNVALPRWLEPIARWFLVTPQMHQVHHSILREETDSNFGFNLPWWDRLFGTYRREPQAGEQGMTIGIPMFRDPRELRLDRLLTQPFRDDPSAAKKSAVSPAGETLSR